MGYSVTKPKLHGVWTSVYNARLPHQIKSYLNIVTVAKIYLVLEAFFVMLQCSLLLNVQYVEFLLLLPI